MKNFQNSQQSSRRYEEESAAFKPITLRTMLTMPSGESSSNKKELCTLPLRRLPSNQYKCMKNSYAQSSIDSDEDVDADEDYEDSKTVVIRGPSGDRNIKDEDAYQIDKYFEVEITENTNTGNTNVEETCTPRGLFEIINGSRSNNCICNACLSYHKNNIEDEKMSLPERIFTAVLPNSRKEKRSSCFNVSQQTSVRNIHTETTQENIRRKSLEIFPSNDTLYKSKIVKNKCSCDGKKYLQEAIRLSTQTVESINAISDLIKSGVELEETQDDRKSQTSRSAVVRIRQRIRDKYTKNGHKTRSCQTEKTVPNQINILYDTIKEIFHSSSHRCEKWSPNNLSGRNMKPIFSGHQNILRVLKQLHDDFEELDRKYDYMSMMASRGVYRDCEIQLQQLERELDKKEDEVSTILCLCREIVEQQHQLSQYERSTRMKDCSTCIPYDFNRRSRLQTLPFC